MYKLTCPPKQHPLSRKLAQEFAEMTGAPRDRPLSEKRIEIYERLVGAGAFYPCVWSRCTCKETDGITYRVNGKHTSTMFSKMEKMPSGLHVIVQDFHADTLDDVARLYASFDSRISSRNTSDINSSFAGTIPELAAVPLRTINITVSGLAYHLWQDSYAGHPAAERAELLLDQSGFCLFVNELLCGKGAKVMYRFPVCAAIFGSFKKSQKDCESFWTAVRDETGEKPTLPDRVLAKMLTTSHMKTRGIANMEKNRLTNRAIYVKCIHGWNAWRRSSTTDLKYLANKPVPAFA